MFQQRIWSLMNSNSIILGSSKGNLNLVFLKPKRKRCDASITEVLSDRLQETDVEILEQYKKHFTKKEGGINMTKIRVKVSFYDEAGNYFCSAISPQTVVDNGNKKLGCLEVYDCHPRKSNLDGGRKIMMISEYTLSDDVVPRFELYDAEGHQRENVEEYLVQPIKSSSTMAIKNATAIIFLTPRQPHWDTIKNLIPDYSLKLVAYREGDGRKSRALAFDYTTACDHQMDGDEDAKIEIQDRAKPGAKKRNMNIQTLQVPNVKKARTASGGSYVDAPPQVVTAWPSPGGSSGYNTTGSSPPQPAPNYPDLFTSTKGDEHYPDFLSGGPESCEAGVRMMVGWEKNPDQMLKTEEAFDQMSARSSHSGNSEDHLCQILGIPKAQEAEDLMNIPTNTLLDPNSPERMVDTQQEQHDSEEEHEDLMNIETSTLLDASSPERLEDIHHQEQHDSEDDQQTELNTPVIIPDLETLFPRAPPQVVRSQQNVFLPLRGLIQADAMTKPKTFKDEDFQPSAGPLEDGLRSRQANRAPNKTKTVPKTVAAPRTDLAQLFTVFTVLFILLLCVVQITTNILGVPLNTFPLVGITSVLSLGIVGAKFAKS